MADKPQVVLTLGPLVAEWIEENCVIPDREVAGEPFVLTGEMRSFVDRFYAFDAATGRFVYQRGGQYVRPQKHGKGPFSAALICAEAAGPVRPVRVGDDWTGVPWATPWIQVTAVSEEQAANVWRALIPMIQLSRLHAEIPDSGLTRVNLPGGGRIEPVTASARSRLGQRVTFVVQDETHSWLQSNGGLALADNQRRNLAGMGGRFLETTNAFDPQENSVAQRTQTEPGVLVDDVDGGPGSVRNVRERHRVMRKVYGDSLIERGGWVDLHRIDIEIEALLEHDPAQAERFFLNRKHASEGAAFDVEAWKKLAVPRTVEPHSMISLGIDGARHDDAIAVVACELKTGYLWPVIILERPPHAPEDYEHDLDRVDGAVSDVFERFNVWRAYCDPHHLEGLIEGWQNRYGDKRVIHWLTNRPRQIAWAIRNFTEALSAGDLSHDGDETLTTHVRQARRRKMSVLDDNERRMHTLCKDAIASPRKIDAAMAAVLAWEARGDALAAGAVTLGDLPAPPQPQYATWQPGMALSADDLGVLMGAEHGPMGSMS